MAAKRENKKAHLQVDRLIIEGSIASDIEVKRLLDKSKKRTRNEDEQGPNAQPNKVVKKSECNTSNPATSNPSNNRSIRDFMNNNTPHVHQD